MSSKPVAIFIQTVSTGSNIIIVNRSSIQDRLTAVTEAFHQEISLVRARADALSSEPSYKYSQPSISLNLKSNTSNSSSSSSSNNNNNNNNNNSYVDGDREGLDKYAEDGIGVDIGLNSPGIGSVRSLGSLIDSITGNADEEAERAAAAAAAKATISTIPQTSTTPSSLFKKLARKTHISPQTAGGLTPSVDLGDAQDDFDDHREQLCLRGSAILLNQYRAHYVLINEVYAVIVSKVSANPYSTSSLIHQLSSIIMSSCKSVAAVKPENLMKKLDTLYFTLDDLLRSIPSQRLEGHDKSIATVAIAKTWKNHISSFALRSKTLMKLETTSIPFKFNAVVSEGEQEGEGEQSDQKKKTVSSSASVHPTPIASFGPSFFPDPRKVPIPVSQQAQQVQQVAQVQGEQQSTTQVFTSDSISLQQGQQQVQQQVQVQQVQVQQQVQPQQVTPVAFEANFGTATFEATFDSQQPTTTGTTTTKDDVSNNNNTETNNFGNFDNFGNFGDFSSSTQPQASTSSTNNNFNNNTNTNHPKTNTNDTFEASFPSPTDKLNISKEATSSQNDSNNAQFAVDFGSNNFESNQNSANNSTNLNNNATTTTTTTANISNSNSTSNSNSNSNSINEEPIPKRKDTIGSLSGISTARMGLQHLYKGASEDSTSTNTGSSQATGQQQAPPVTEEPRRTSIASPGSGRIPNAQPLFASASLESIEKVINSPEPVAIVRKSKAEAAFSFIFKEVYHVSHVGGKVTRAKVVGRIELVIHTDVNERNGTELPNPLIIPFQLPNAKEVLSGATASKWAVQLTPSTYETKIKDAHKAPSGKGIPLVQYSVKPDMISHPLKIDVKWAADPTRLAIQVAMSPNFGAPLEEVGVKVRVPGGLVSSEMSPPGEQDLSNSVVTWIAPSIAAGSESFVLSSTFTTKERPSEMPLPILFKFHTLTSLSPLEFNCNPSHNSGLKLEAIKKTANTGTFEAQI